MKIRNASDGDDKVELQMTSMIDIVFQLLVFFIMTFKIVTMEGDFNIKMPLEGPSAGSMELEPPTPPIMVRMSAMNASDGRLGRLEVKIGQAAYVDIGRGEAAFEQLRNKIIDHVGDERGPESTAAQTELELDCAANLHYRETVAAITAVSGYPDDDGNLVSLIQNIKFKPQPKPDE